MITSFKNIRFLIFICLVGVFSFPARAELSVTDTSLHIPEIAGSDTNNNGIWDYIDDYIDENYPDPSDIRSAVQQYAMTLQKALLETEDPAAALNNVIAFYRSIDCLYDATDETSASFISDELEAVMVNTPARSNAYLTLSDQMAGKITEETSCHE